MVSLIFGLTTARFDDVRLKLHQQLVIGHAAIDAQRFEAHAGILFHRPQHFPCLERGRFENGAGEMAAIGEACQADDGSPRAVVPVGRVEPGEGRHEVDAAVVGDRARERLDLRSCS